MKKHTLLSKMSKLNAVALLCAAAGFLLQIVSGSVKVPVVPPGLLIQLIPAGLIALGHWKWAPATGVVAALFLTMGLFASGSASRLLDVSQLSGFIGLWVQFVAQVVALVAGSLATIQNLRRQDSK